MTHFTWPSLRRALTAAAAVPGLTAALGAAVFSLMPGVTAVAAARDTAIYSVWFKGFRCHREAIHSTGSDSDETFVIVTALDRKRVFGPMRIPTGQDGYYPDVDQNEIRRANVKVWQGSAQTVNIRAQVFDFDGHARNAVALITGVTAGIGQVLISRGLLKGPTTGPTRGATIFGGNIGSVIYALVQKNMRAGGHDHLGSASVKLDLARAGKLADRPQRYIVTTRGSRLDYDLSTHHRGGGAHYELYWEVRRTRQAPTVARAKPRTVRLCNRTRVSKIFTALAYLDSAKGRKKSWTSKGWFGVKRNQCIEFPIKNPGDVYVYANAGSREWRGRDAAFCINRFKTFKIPAADSARCKGRTYKRVNMSKIKTRKGRNTFNFK